MMTTKWPLAPILMETAIQLRSRQVELDLDWIPRLQNIEADAITNSDFAAFDDTRRIAVTAESLSDKFILLPKLLALGEEFQNDLAEKREARAKDAADELAGDGCKELTKGSNLGRRKGRKRPASQRLRNTDPW